MIPIERVLNKYDEHLRKNELEAADRHLKYWLDEARAKRDERCRYTMLNELLGLCRRREDTATVEMYIEEMLNMMETEGLSDKITGATGLLNIATVYKWLGRNADAVSFYEKAQKVYLDKLPENDVRQAALNNNLAMAYIGLASEAGRTEEEKNDNYLKADNCLQKALQILDADDAAVNGCNVDKALTYLNLAELVECRYGLEQGENGILIFLNKAIEVFDDEKCKRDSYYAFTAEKAVSVFSYYGFFAYVSTLKERIEKITGDV